MTATTITRRSTTLDALDEVIADYDVTTILARLLSHVDAKPGWASVAFYLGEAQSEAEEVEKAIAWAAQHSS